MLGNLRHQPQAKHEPDREQGGRHNRKSTPCQRDRRPAENRDAEVEDDLDRERPARHDSDQTVAGAEIGGQKMRDRELQEHGVREQRRRPAKQLLFEEQRDDKENRPIGRKDPQRPVHEVLTDSRSRSAAHRARDIRPEQQKTAQDEEQGHAGCEMRQHLVEWAKGRRFRVGTGVQPDVVDKDRERREGTQPLDTDQPVRTAHVRNRSALWQLTAPSPASSPEQHCSHRSPSAARRSTSWIAIPTSVTAGRSVGGAELRCD